MFNISECQISNKTLSHEIMCSLVNLNKLKKMKKGVCHVVIFFNFFINYFHYSCCLLLYH